MAKRVQVIKARERKKASRVRAATPPKSLEMGISYAEPKIGEQMPREIREARGDAYAREKVMLNGLVIHTSQMINQRLDQQLERGKAGWWTDQVSQNNLRQRLAQANKDNRMLDVAILAMMLHARGESL